MVMMSMGVTVALLTEKQEKAVGQSKEWGVKGIAWVEMKKMARRRHIRWTLR